MMSEMEALRLPGRPGGGRSSVIGRANKYIDENAALGTGQGRGQQAPPGPRAVQPAGVPSASAPSLLTPFMPETCAKIFAQIGADEGARTWESRRRRGACSPAGRAPCIKGENLFPRIDVEKELDEPGEPLAEAQQGRPPRRGVGALCQESVDFDTFCKCDFRAVQGQGL